MILSKNPDKVNLGVGVYREADGKPRVLECVKRAEKMILEDPNLDKEYLGMAGHQGFVQDAKEIQFGKDCLALQEKRIGTVQTISGTGALSMGFEFIKKFCPGTVYVSNPTWEVHEYIIEKTGLVQASFPYWDNDKKNFNFKGTLDCLDLAPQGSVVLFQAMPHNPTGSDPSEDEWRELGSLCKKRKLIPFFDTAYQGFASGEIEIDSWPVRHFATLDMPMFVAQSLSKAFCLHSDRIGALHVICGAESQARSVVGQLECLARASYLNPPKHGALIVTTIYRNPELWALYLKELDQMTDRIVECRKMLYDQLIRQKAPGDWKRIVSQKGLLCFSGLTPDQCKHLNEKWGVWLLSNGRIAVTGINYKNVEYVAKAISDAASCV